MYAAAVKSKKDNKSSAAANSVGQKRSSKRQDLGFVDGRNRTLQTRSIHTLVKNKMSMHANRVWQCKYDVEGYTSWEEHYDEIIDKVYENYFPKGLGLTVDTLSRYIENPPTGANAIFIPPYQEGLTKVGKTEFILNKKGYILLSEAYVDSLKALNADERVSILKSTIRHELRHYHNQEKGLIGEKSSGGDQDLDEVIAHSENILNEEMGGKEPEDPLWDQIDHLVMAEDYMRKANEYKIDKSTEIYKTAVAKLDEATNKLNKELRAIIGSEKESKPKETEIIKKYLDAVDLEYSGKASLKDRSEVWQKIKMELKKS